MIIRNVWTNFYVQQKLFYPTRILMREPLKSASKVGKAYNLKPAGVATYRSDV